MSIQDPNIQNDVIETQMAVDSIIDKEHNYNINNDNLTDLKRKREQTDLDTQDVGLNNTTFDNPSHEHKKSHFQRFYRHEHKGPYEVIIQDKEKRKISNPFKIGKILQTHHTQIDHITRSGKNLSVICNSYNAANDIVTSQHLLQYNVFIPSNKIHTTGVIFIEPEISENEIIEGLETKAVIISATRIKRRLNHELKNTNFVKIVFDSDELPNYVYLNYVRMKVEQYMIPVKQCYRCFAYGHVASSPCQKNRLCRDCGESFHEGECLNSKKCVHCLAPHSSNSKQCPEYIRQKSIKTRMSLFKEDYNKASLHYPITYKKVRGPYLSHRTFSDTVKSNRLNTEHFPQLHPRYSEQLPTYSPADTHISNQFSVLSEEIEPTFNKLMTPNHWLRNPNTRRPSTYNKQNYMNSASSQKVKEKTIPVVTLSPKTSNPNACNTIDRDHLHTLLQSKLKEIRDKIHATTHTSNIKNIKMEMIDEVFAKYIGLTNEPRKQNIKTPDKTSKLNTITKGVSSTNLPSNKNGNKRT